MFQISILDELAHREVSDGEQPSSRGREAVDKKVQVQDICDGVRDILVDDEADQVDGSWSHDPLVELPILSIRSVHLCLRPGFGHGMLGQRNGSFKAVVDFHSLKILCLQQMEVYSLLHMDPCNARPSLPVACTVTRDRLSISN